MKNFWLDKKAQRGINLMTRSGHALVMDDEVHSVPPWNTSTYQGFDFDASQIDENDFVDLSSVIQHNSRYKEYERLHTGYGFIANERRTKMQETLETYGNTKQWLL